MNATPTGAAIAANLPGVKQELESHPVRLALANYFNRLEQDLKCVEVAARGGCAAPVQQRVSPRLPRKLTHSHPVAGLSWAMRLPSVAAPGVAGARNQLCFAFPFQMAARLHPTEMVQTVLEYG